MQPLPTFLLLYAAMYAAYGVASPFLPAFLSARGLPPEDLGLVLAAGTAIRRMVLSPRSLRDCRSMFGPILQQVARLLTQFKLKPSTV